MKCHKEDMRRLNAVKGILRKEIILQVIHFYWTAIIPNYWDNHLNFVVV